MNDEHDSTGDPKLPYEPPRLRRVELRVEEAVLGFCKVSTGSGPGSACDTAGAPCFVDGS
jgi:hypothetical protein